jgi:hypothetical protein
MLLTPGGWEICVADLRMLVGWDSILFEVLSFEEAVRRAECVENMQRLALAIMLYRLENDKVLDENWGTQIKPYLGEHAERYFSCPSNPSPEGMTTYALVRYADIVGGTLDTFLVVELTEAVPFDEALVSFDDVPELMRRDRTVRQGNRTFRTSAHPGGMNVAYRSGAVRFLPREQEPMSEELQRAWEMFFRIVDEHGVEKANELLRVLMREVQEHGEEKTIEMLRSLGREEE